MFNEIKNKSKTHKHTLLRFLRNIKQQHIKGDEGEDKWSAIF